MKNTLLALLLGVPPCLNNFQPVDSLEQKPRVQCLSGVLYYRTGQGIAPAYRKDGKLKLCDWGGE